jgi:hypothetical protein
MASNHFAVAAREHRDLECNSRMLLHMLSTAASFFRGLRA